MAVVEAYPAASRPELYSMSTLKQCSFCSRRFIPASLEKHEKVCQRTFIDKRKVFNSQQQRITDPHSISNTARSNTSRSGVDSELNTTYRKSRWREKHADLISTIRAARGCSDDGSGHPVLTRIRSLVPSEYILCEFCKRYFSPKAADRHIEWCKEQKARIAQSPKAAVAAKERLHARTKYKAPTLKKKNPKTRGVKVLQNDSAPNRKKPPLYGSATKSLGTADSLNNNSNNNNNNNRGDVRISGTSISPPRKQETSELGKRVRKSLTKPQPSLITVDDQQMDSFVHGKSLHPVKSRNSSYNPYKAAEEQMRDLLKGNNADTRVAGQTRLRDVERTLSQKGGPPTRAQQQQSSTTTHHPPAATRPAMGPQMIRRTVQVRDPPALNKRSSRHVPSSDSDDESGIRYSERGSGDLRATYTLISSSDNVNRNGNVRLHNSSRNSLASQESDLSSTLHRNTPSPPLKLPAATSAKSNHQWQLGHSTVRSSDVDQRLSTSSSDSSLPPLSIINNNNNNGQHQRRNRTKLRTNGSSEISEGRTACFCHECGTGYPLSTAKFCCECGTRRLCLL